MELWEVERQHFSKNELHSLPKKVEEYTPTIKWQAVNFMTLKFSVIRDSLKIHLSFVTRQLRISTIGLENKLI